MTGAPTPPAVTIRRGTPADAAALTDLHLDVWDEAYADLVPRRILDERRRRADERVNRWAEILTEPRPTWLAEDAEGRLVGFASAGPGRDNDIAADVETELWSLYVRASHYGTGLGETLLTTAIGDRSAYLWVLAGNARAIGFYQRHGFRLDGTEDQHDEGLHVRMVRAGT